MGTEHVAADGGAGITGKSEVFALDAQPDDDPALRIEVDGADGSDLDALDLYAIAALEATAVAEQECDVHAAAEDGSAEHPEEAPEENASRDNGQQSDGGEVAVALVHCVRFR